METWSNNSRRRRPLVPLALAAIAGLLIDRFLLPGRTIWLALAGGAVVAGTVAERRSAIAQAFLLLAVGSLFGAWHDDRQRLISDRDVSLFAGDAPVIAHVVGVIASSPEVVTPDPGIKMGRPVEPSTRFELQVREIVVRDERPLVDGRAQVRWLDAKPDWRLGDEIEFIGLLERPRPPLNPGEFDYAAFLADRGIRATLFVESSSSLVRHQPPTHWSLSRALDSVRQSIRRSLSATLTPPAAALADALLIGTRSGLSARQRLAYFEGGVIHLLVVSGLQVGMVAAFTWWLGSMVGLPPRGRACLSIALVWAYALLAGANPSVSRAAVVATIWLGGWLLFRPSDAINSLSAAALVVLAHDPNDLFRPGPQLSFLCVLSIIAVAEPLRSVFLGRSMDPFDAFDARRRWLRNGFRRALWGIALSAVVWLVTSPLATFHFHLLTPMSTVTTALASPVVAVAMLLGTALAMGHWAFAQSLAPLAWMEECLLWAIDATVTWTARAPGAFFYVPSAPAWWLSILYALLLLPLVLKGSPRWRWGMGMGCVAWMLMGAVFLLSPSRPKALEHHQLAVGHGSCAVLRFENGVTLMHDCGSLTVPEVGARIVAPWCWSEGVGRIDVIFLSHADVDHFNGVADLARRIPVGHVRFTPALARSRQPEVARLFDELSGLGVPMGLSWHGEVWSIGSSTVKVLAPDPGVGSLEDNESSMVLDVEHRGRRLLLTGDLEKRGLDRLLANRPGPVDVLVAPHHGSRGSNPTKLVQWARPRLVLSTQDRGRGRQDGLDGYRALGARVVRTDERGCVRCRWLEEGIETAGFRDQRIEVVPWP